MTEFTLHCFAQSGHSYKSALMLAMCGADWAPHWVDFFHGASRSPEFRDGLNAMGECPVLVHGDQVLTQSGVINDYLSEHFGAYGPENAHERREILRWTLWENHKLNSFLGSYRFFRNFAPEKARNPDVMAFLQGRALAAVKTLDQHMHARDWVAADRPTTADFACAGYAFYPEEEYGFSFDDYPHFSAWKARLSGLRGWAHPYDLMPGHPFKA